MFYSGLIFHNAIAAVCPISGIRIGDPTNPATWLFYPTAAATPAQIAAAQAVVARITPATLAQADATVAAAAVALPNPLATAQATALTQIAPAAVG